MILIFIHSKFMILCFQTLPIRDNHLSFHVKIYTAGVTVLYLELISMEDHQKKFIISLLAYAAQRDISPEILCKLSNVTIGNLYDPDIKLSQKNVIDFWRNAIHLSNDILFGLHFGESL